MWRFEPDLDRNLVIYIYAAIFFYRYQVNDSCVYFTIFKTILHQINITTRPSILYCAWLIKWAVKREIIQLAELCHTGLSIISGTWWYWVRIWRYWLVLGQYKLILLGTRWYRVSKGLVGCIYCFSKGSVPVWKLYTGSAPSTMFSLFWDPVIRYIW